MILKEVQKPDLLNLEFQYYFLNFSASLPNWTLHYYNLLLIYFKIINKHFKQYFTLILAI